MKKVWKSYFHPNSASTTLESMDQDYVKFAPKVGDLVQHGGKTRWRITEVIHGDPSPIRAVVRLENV